MARAPWLALLVAAAAASDYAVTVTFSTEPASDTNGAMSVAFFGAGGATNFAELPAAVVGLAPPGSSFSHTVSVDTGGAPLPDVGSLAAIRLRTEGANGIYPHHVQVVAPDGATTFYRATEGADLDSVSFTIVPTDTIDLPAFCSPIPEETYTFDFSLSAFDVHTVGFSVRLVSSSGATLPPRGEFSSDFVLVPRESWVVGANSVSVSFPGCPLADLAAVNFMHISPDDGSVHVASMTVTTPCGRVYTVDVPDEPTTVTETGTQYGDASPIYSKTFSVAETAPGSGCPSSDADVETCFDRCGAPVCTGKDFGSVLHDAVCVKIARNPSSRAPVCAPDGGLFDARFSDPTLDNSRQSSCNMLSDAYDSDTCPFVDVHIFPGLYYLDPPLERTLGNSISAPEWTDHYLCSGSSQCGPLQHPNYPIWAMTATGTCDVHTLRSVELVSVEDPPVPQLAGTCTGSDFGGIFDGMACRFLGQHSGSLDAVTQDELGDSCSMASASQPLSDSCPAAPSSGLACTAATTDHHHDLYICDLAPDANCSSVGSGDHVLVRAESGTCTLSSHQALSWTSDVSVPKTCGLSEFSEYLGDIFDSPEVQCVPHANFAGGDPGAVGSVDPLYSVAPAQSIQSMIERMYPGEFCTNVLRTRPGDLDHGCPTIPEPFGCEYWEPNSVWYMCTPRATCPDVSASTVWMLRLDAESCSYHEASMFQVTLADGTAPGRPTAEVNQAAVDPETNVENGAAGTQSSTFTLHGKSSCPADSELVYSGVLGGSPSTKGGAADFLCLDTSNVGLASDPNFNVWRGRTQAVVYMTNATFIAPGAGYADVHMQQVPCALCRVRERASWVQYGNPACPRPYTTLASGFAFGSHEHHHAAATETVCIDSSPEAVPGGTSGSGGRLFPTMFGHKPGMGSSGRTPLACAVCAAPRGATGHIGTYFAPTCPSSTTPIFEGSTVFSSAWNIPGATTDFLCPTPHLEHFPEFYSSDTGHVHPAEFESFFLSPTIAPLSDFKLRCSVCQARPYLRDMLVVPGREACPSELTLAYKGIMVGRDFSDSVHHRSVSEAICMSTNITDANEVFPRDPGGVVYPLRIGTDRWGSVATDTMLTCAVCLLHQPHLVVWGRESCADSMDDSHTLYTGAAMGKKHLNSDDDVIVTPLCVPSEIHDSGITLTGWHSPGLDIFEYQFGQSDNVDFGQLPPLDLHEVPCAVCLHKPFADVPDDTDVFRVFGCSNCPAGTHFHYNGFAVAGEGHLLHFEGHYATQCLHRFPQQLSSVSSSDQQDGSLFFQQEFLDPRPAGTVDGFEVSCAVCASLPAPYCGDGLSSSLSLCDRCGAGSASPCRSRGPFDAEAVPTSVFLSLRSGHVCDSVVARAGQCEATVGVQTIDPEMCPGMLPPVFAGLQHFVKIKPNPTEFAPGSSMSVGAWILPSGAPTAPGVVIDHWDNHGGLVLALAGDSDGFSCAVHGADGSVAATLTGGSVPNGQWVHVLCTAEPGAQALVVDGAAVDSASVPTFARPAADTWAIVGRSRDARHGMDRAVLVDVFVADRVISSADQTLVRAFDASDSCALWQPAGVCPGSHAEAATASLVLSLDGTAGACVGVPSACSSDTAGASSLADGCSATAEVFAPDDLGIRIVSTSEFLRQVEFTVSLWVRALSASGAQDVALAGFHDGASGWEIRLVTDGTQPGTSVVFSFGQEISAPAYLDTWVHVWATIGGDRIPRLHVNGRAALTHSDSLVLYTPPAVGTELAVGAGFAGAITHMTYWEYGLDPPGLWQAPRAVDTAIVWADIVTRSGAAQRFTISADDVPAWAVVGGPTTRIGSVFAPVNPLGAADALAGLGGNATVQSASGSASWVPDHVRFFLADGEHPDFSIPAFADACGAVSIAEDLTGRTDEVTGTVSVDARPSWYPGRAAGHCHGSAHQQVYLWTAPRTGEAKLVFSGDAVSAQLIDAVSCSQIACSVSRARTFVHAGQRLLVVIGLIGATQATDASFAFHIEMVDRTWAALAPGTTVMGGTFSGEHIRMETPLAAGAPLAWQVRTRWAGYADVDLGETDVAVTMVLVDAVTGLEEARFEYNPRVEPTSVRVPVARGDHFAVFSSAAPGLLRGRISAAVFTDSDVDVTMVERGSATYTVGSTPVWVGVASQSPAAWRQETQRGPEAVLQVRARALGGEAQVYVRDVTTWKRVGWVSVAFGDGADDWKAITVRHVQPRNHMVFIKRLGDADAEIEIDVDTMRDGDYWTMCSDWARPLTRREPVDLGSTLGPFNHAEQRWFTFAIDGSDALYPHEIAPPLGTMRNGCSDSSTTLPAKTFKWTAPRAGTFEIAVDMPYYDTFANLLNIQVSVWILEGCHHVVCEEGAGVTTTVSLSEGEQVIIGVTALVRSTFDPYRFLVKVTEVGLPTVAPCDSLAVASRTEYAINIDRRRMRHTAGRSIQSWSPTLIPLPGECGLTGDEPQRLFQIQTGGGHLRSDEPQVVSGSETFTYAVDAETDFDAVIALVDPATCAALSCSAVGAGVAGSVEAELDPLKTYFVVVSSVGGAGDMQISTNRVRWNQAEGACLTHAGNEDQNIGQATGGYHFGNVTSTSPTPFGGALGSPLSSVEIGCGAAGLTRQYTARWAAPISGVLTVEVEASEPIIVNVVRASLCTVGACDHSGAATTAKATLPVLRDIEYIIVVQSATDGAEVSFKYTLSVRTGVEPGYQSLWSLPFAQELVLGQPVAASTVLGDAIIGWNPPLRCATTPYLRGHVFYPPHAGNFVFTLTDVEAGSDLTLGTGIINDGGLSTCADPGSPLTVSSALLAEPIVVIVFGQSGAVKSYEITATVGASVAAEPPRPARIKFQPQVRRRFSDESVPTTPYRPGKHIVDGWALENVALTGPSGEVACAAPTSVTNITAAAMVFDSFVASSPLYVRLIDWSVVAAAEFDAPETGVQTGAAGQRLGGGGYPVFADDRAWFYHVDGTTEFGRTWDFGADSDGAFFPIDGVGHGVETGSAHNTGFSAVVVAEFVYTGAGGALEVEAGGGDLWVYLGDVLVVDLGGVHPTECRSVDLAKATLEAAIVVRTCDGDVERIVHLDEPLRPGARVALSVFFAQRSSTVESVLNVRSTMALWDPDWASPITMLVRDLKFGGASDEGIDVSGEGWTTGLTVDVPLGLFSGYAADPTFANFFHWFGTDASDRVSTSALHREIRYDGATGARHMVVNPHLLMYPVDGVGFGPEPFELLGHNAGWVSSFVVEFTYRGAGMIEFRSPMDVWVYNDVNMLLDMGGSGGDADKCLRMRFDDAHQSTTLPVLLCQEGSPESGVVVTLSDGPWAYGQTKRLRVFVANRFREINAEFSIVDYSLDLRAMPMEFVGAEFRDFPMPDAVVHSVADFLPEGTVAHEQGKWSSTLGLDGKPVPLDGDYVTSAGRDAMEKYFRDTPRANRRLGNTDVEVIAYPAGFTTFTLHFVGASDAFVGGTHPYSMFTTETHLWFVIPPGHPGNGTAFLLTSDDDSLLFVNGDLVIDNGRYAGHDGVAKAELNGFGAFEVSTTGDLWPAYTAALREALVPGVPFKVSIFHAERAVLGSWSMSSPLDYVDAASGEARIAPQPERTLRFRVPFNGSFVVKATARRAGVTLSVLGTCVPIEPGHQVQIEVSDQVAGDTIMVSAVGPAGEIALADIFVEPLPTSDAATSAMINTAGASPSEHYGGGGGFAGEIVAAHRIAVRLRRVAEAPRMDVYAALVSRSAGLDFAHLERAGPFAWGTELAFAVAVDQATAPVLAVIVGESDLHPADFVREVTVSGQVFGAGAPGMFVSESDAVQAEEMTIVLGAPAGINTALVVESPGGRTVARLEPGAVEQSAPMAVADLCDVELMVVTPQGDPLPGPGLSVRSAWTEGCRFSFDGRLSATGSTVASSSYTILVSGGVPDGVTSLVVEAQSTETETVVGLEPVGGAVNVTLPAYLTPLSSLTNGQGLAMPALTVDGISFVPDGGAVGRVVRESTTAVFLEMTLLDASVLAEAGVTGVAEFSPAEHQIRFHGSDESVRGTLSGSAHFVTASFPVDPFTVIGADGVLSIELVGAAGVASIQVIDGDSYEAAATGCAAETLFVRVDGGYAVQIRVRSTGHWERPRFQFGGSDPDLAFVAGSAPPAPMCLDAGGAYAVTIYRNEVEDWLRVTEVTVDNDELPSAGQFRITALAVTDMFGLVGEFVGAGETVVVGAEGIVLPRLAPGGIEIGVASAPGHTFVGVLGAVEGVKNVMVIGGPRALVDGPGCRSAVVQTVVALNAACTGIAETIDLEMYVMLDVDADGVAFMDFGDEEAFVAGYLFEAVSVATCEQTSRVAVVQ